MEALYFTIPAAHLPGMLNCRFGNNNFTLLHEAAFRARDNDDRTAGIITALLTAGANLLATDKGGRRPLMVAATDGHTNAVKVCVHAVVPGSLHE